MLGPQRKQQNQTPAFGQPLQQLQSLLPLILPVSSQLQDSPELAPCTEPSCAHTTSALSPHGLGAQEEPPHAKRSSWQNAQWGEEGKAGKSWEKSQHELTQIVPCVRAKAVILFYFIF